MGLCGSKEVEINKTAPVSTGRRLGAASARPEPKRPPPLNLKRAKQRAGPGVRLGSIADGADKPSDGGATTAKQMAARAAADRLEDKKKREEKGTLGRKLAAEKRKSTKEMALESYNRRNDQQLVYD